MTQHMVVTITDNFGEVKGVKYGSFVHTLLKKQTEQEEALHIGLGICGEAGELADAIKKEYIYGKARDKENVVEELGDLLFYIQAAMNHYDLSLEEVLVKNVNKLSERYVGLVYSDKAAQDRADKFTPLDVISGIMPTYGKLSDNSGDQNV